jgi:hypothetical protein
MASSPCAFAAGDDHLPPPASTTVCCWYLCFIGDLLVDEGIFSNVGRHLCRTSLLWGFLLEGRSMAVCGIWMCLTWYYKSARRGVVVSDDTSIMELPSPLAPILSTSPPKLLESGHRVA